MPGLADRMADLLLSRSVHLARFEAGERRRVRGILTELERRIVAALRTIDPTEPGRQAFQRRRLDTLLREVRAITRTRYRRLADGQTTLLEAIALFEGPGTAQAINAAIGVDLLTAGLSEAHLRTVADDLLVQGAPAQTWWSRQAGTLVQQFTDEMRQGVLLGDSLRDLIQRTRRIVGVADRHAEALVRTSVQSVENATRQALFTANRDVLRGQQWIITLDTRACPICIALSGTVWDFDGNVLEGKRGRFPGPPPAHWQCRCVMVPIVKAFEALRRARGARLQRQLDAIQAGQRQALDGDLATDLTFVQWLGLQPERTQRAILGQQRFALWRDGKLRLTQLTGQDHRPLTLDRLRERAA